jgi:glycosyltransferase involved in cell wall biosynthesis
MPSDDLRVVILTYDHGGGGMDHYAANLARGLREYCECSVHTIGRDDGITTATRWARLCDRARVIRQVRRFYNPFRGRTVARDLMQRYKPNVVHITSSVPCTHGLVTELRRHGILVAATVHDPLPHRENRTAWGKLHTSIMERWVSGRNLAAVDLVHVHSKPHTEILKRRYPDLVVERMYCVQHGGGLPAEVAAGSAVPAELSGDGADQDCVLFFGRIEPYKGVGVLFEAMSMLVAQFPATHLIVAGSGHLPPIPKDIEANLLLLNRFIEDREIKAIFTRSLFIVLPYLEATQTGVVPLASAFELPAVVSRAGALPELVQDNVTGILVDAGDAQGLAAAMKQMISSPTQTRAMGRAARSYMESHYEWSVVARSHYERYLSHQRLRASA